MKITTKELKSLPNLIVCNCGSKIGFIRINKGFFYYADIIARTITKIESKNIDVYCWNCGKGYKITPKK